MITSAVTTTDSAGSEQAEQHFFACNRHK